MPSGLGEKQIHVRTVWSLKAKAFSKTECLSQTSLQDVLAHKQSISLLFLMHHFFFHCIKFLQLK